MPQKTAWKHAGDLMCLSPEVGLYSFLLVREFFKLYLKYVIKSISVFFVYSIKVSHLKIVEFDFQFRSMHVNLFQDNI